MKGVRRSPQRETEGGAVGRRAPTTSTGHSITRSRSWRWRRCYRCKRVEPAGRFQVAQTYRPGWRDSGSMRRSCPHCGAEGRTDDFAVVRERRAS